MGQNLFAGCWDILNFCSHTFMNNGHSEKYSNISNSLKVHIAIQKNSKKMDPHPVGLGLYHVTLCVAYLKEEKKQAKNG